MIASLFVQFIKILPHQGNALVKLLRPSQNCTGNKLYGNALMGFQYLVAQAKTLNIIHRVNLGYLLGLAYLAYC